MYFGVIWYQMLLLPKRNFNIKAVKNKSHIKLMLFYNCLIYNLHCHFYYKARIQYNNSFLCRKFVSTTGTCFIHGSCLLTNTTRYCTQDQNLSLQCVLFLIILYLTSFFFLHLVRSIGYFYPCQPIFSSSHWDKLLQIAH